MKAKSWLLLVFIITFVVQGCAPGGISPAETVQPTPSLSPSAEPSPSPTSTQVVPVPGGIAMIIGQHGSGEGEFMDPHGIALDAQGNIYVADTGNGRIEVFDRQGGFLTAIADERFTAPRYVAVDPAGRIYVADAAERVHLLSATGEPIQSFGEAGSLLSQFSGIADLVLDSAGDLYVVDSGNDRVQKFSLLSGPLFSFGDEGEPAELLSRPQGIALDSEGNVYVADSGHRRIQLYAPGGTYLQTFDGELTEPRDLAVDGQGNIYVSDGEEDVVQVVDREGVVIIELGEGQLSDPWGIAVDEGGRVFVVDAGNQRVVALAPPAEAPPVVPTPSPELTPTPSLAPVEGMAPWPMYGSDAQHSGRALAEGPASPALKWTFRAGLFANSPAVGADGSIYFGSLDGNLYALNPGGEEVWRAVLGQISGVPAVGGGGMIYVGVASPEEEMFYALNRDGTAAWGYHIESHIVESSPIVGPDGSIYLGASNPQTGGGAVAAVHPDGSEKWRYAVGSRIPFSPALGQDGTVYVGAGNGRLYALKADGGLKWEINPGTVSSSPSVAADGTIYVGAGDAYQALNPDDGSQIWSFSPPDGEADSRPALGRGGRVYLTSNGSEVYALDHDGNLIWTFAAEVQDEREVHFSSSVTVDGATVLYAGTREGELFAINPDGSLRWRFALPEMGMVPAEAVIGADGTLYVGAGSNLYAVGQ